jgi:hypothetical protein
MLSLIIKGNRFQAARAAADRGVALAFARETRWNETIGTAPNSAYDKVVEWFGEDAWEPPKVGSLLCYSLQPQTVS